MNLVGVSGGEFRTNSRGIRGPEFSDTDRYRILCVGGSTTECLYLDDVKSWPHVLGERLGREGPGVWVGNVGMSGTLAVTHAVLLEHLPEATMVDCWIVLCGINDYGQQLGGQYQNSAANAWSQAFRYRRPGLAASWRRPLQRNLYTFASMERLRKAVEATARGDSVVYQDVFVHWVDDLRNARSRAEKVEVPSPPESWLSEYESHLSRIIELSRARKVRLVFLTQPVFWSEEKLPAELSTLILGGRLSDATYAMVSSLSRGLELYNRRMRDVCRREGIE